MKFNGGYTLIEILVSLTIIGLLFGFGFANYRDFSRRQELSGVVKTVQGDLRLAEEDAISGQKPVGIGCLDSYGFHVTSKSTYSIEANCGGTATSVKDVNLPLSITINPQPGLLKFKILGQGTNLDVNTDWTLTLVQEGSSNPQTITVTSGGEIK